MEEIQGGGQRNLTAFFRSSSYNEVLFDGGMGMKVIYADTLFLLNGLVDYLLLLCSARLAGEPLHRLRFVLGAVLGGGYAVALFLPGLEWLYHPACRLASAVLMVLIAFSGSRRLLRQCMLFFALSCAFGGGVLAVSLLGGQPLTLDGGVFYSAIDLKIILVSAAMCYLVLSLVFQRWGRHSVTRGELEPITLWAQGKKLTLMALRDTGNTLTDPISGKAVFVAEGDAIKGLFDLEHTDMSQPHIGIERLGRLYPGRFRLLPYRAVGVECGLLLVVRMDRVEMGTRVGKDELVALSPNAVSDGGNYQVLTAWD